MPVVPLRQGLTYGRSVTGTTLHTDVLHVYPGNLKLVEAGAARQHFLVGVPIAPRYSEERDERSKPLNGRLAGHAVPYYTVERVNGRDLTEAFEAEAAPLQMSLLENADRLSACLRSAHALPPDVPRVRGLRRPPALLWAPSGCVLRDAAGARAAYMMQADGCWDPR